MINFIMILSLLSAPSVVVSKNPLLEGVWHKSRIYFPSFFISLLVGRWSFLLVVRNWHVHCPAYWYVP